MMRSESTSALGQPSDTKLIFGAGAGSAAGAGLMTVSADMGQGLAGIDGDIKELRSCGGAFLLSLGGPSEPKACDFCCLLALLMMTGLAPANAADAGGWRKPVAGPVSAYRAVPRSAAASLVWAGDACWRGCARIADASSRFASASTAPAIAWRTTAPATASVSAIAGSMAGRCCRSIFRAVGSSSRAAPARRIPRTSQRAFPARQE